MAATLIVMSSCGGSGGVSPSSGGSNGASPNISAGNWALVATSQILHGYIASAGGNLTSSGSNVTMTANTSAGCTLSLPCTPRLHERRQHHPDFGKVVGGKHRGGYRNRLQRHQHRWHLSEHRRHGEVQRRRRHRLRYAGSLDLRQLERHLGQFIDSNREPVLDSNANPVSPVITASISQADTASANGSFPLSGTMTFTNLPLPFLPLLTLPFASPLARLIPRLAPLRAEP